MNRVASFVVRRLALALLAPVLVQHAGADDSTSWRDTLQFHGFASQAYLATTDNNVFGDSEDGSFDFREVGINASLRPLPTLQLSAQLLSRRAGEGDDGDVRLDYGLLDYALQADAEQSLGIRAGRILNPLGLYNETRDVAFARPSILLPQSIYFDRTRNLALSSDGLHVYAERRTGAGNITLQAGAAIPRADEPDVERSLLGNDFPGDLEGRGSLIGRILFERFDGSLRLALSGANVNIDYDRAGPTDPLAEGQIDFDPIVLSAQYNTERWSYTAEYAQRYFSFSDFGGPTTSFTGESWYLQGSYRIAPHLEAMLRYDVLHTDRDDRDGSEFEAATGAPAHTRFAKDFTVGLRWDITPSVMLRAEYHNVDGTAWLPLEDNPDPAALERRWELFSLLMSVRF